MHGLAGAWACAACCAKLLHCLTMASTQHSRRFATNEVHHTQHNQTLQPTLVFADFSTIPMMGKF